MRPDTAIKTRSRLWRALLPLLMLTLLSRCASVPEAPINVQTRAHIERLQQLEHWQLEGKLGLRLPDDSGSARLNWRSQGPTYELSLSGPLGQGRVDIVGKPGAVTLFQDDEPPLEAPDAETLVYRATGWDLPVTALRHWVLGVPAPDARTEGLSSAETGLIERFSQHGWTVSPSQYRRYGDTPLPGRLVAERDGGDVRLILAIHRWETSVD